MLALWLLPMSHLALQTIHTLRSKWPTAIALPNRKHSRWLQLGNRQKITNPTWRRKSGRKAARGSKRVRWRLMTISWFSNQKGSGERQVTSYQEIWCIYRCTIPLRSRNSSSWPGQTFPMGIHWSIQRTIRRYGRTLSTSTMIFFWVNHLPRHL